MDDRQAALADLVVRETVVDARRHTAHLHVRVRATDTGGAGVGSVQVGSASLSLVSGTPADGWWAGGVAIPRWGPEGYRRIQVVTTDLAENVTWSYPRRLRDRGRPWRYRVLSRPDSVPPALRRAHLADSVVETGSTSASTWVRVRLADELSGVRTASVVLRDEDGAWRWSARLTRVDGTRRDGRWGGDLVLPCGFPAGTYTVQVRALDRAANQATRATGLVLTVR
jgi:hypothetical protein